LYKLKPSMNENSGNPIQSYSHLSVLHIFLL